MISIPSSEDMLKYEKMEKVGNTPKKNEIKFGVKFRSLMGSPIVNRM